MAAVALPSTLIVTLLCFLSFAHAQTPEPVIKIILGQSGLNKVGSVGVDYLRQVFPGLSVSSLSGRYYMLLYGYVDWSVTDVCFPEVTLPAATVVTDPNGQITLAVNDAGFTARGHMRYSYYNILHVLITDNPLFDLTVREVDISLTIKATKDDSGIPQIDVLGCQCTIGYLDVDFHGLTGLVYNLFNGAIAEDLKTALQVTVCEGAKLTANTHGKQELATANMDVPLGGDVKATCKLGQNPLLAVGSVEAALACELTIPGYPPVSFSPAPMPSLPSSSKMVTVGFSAELAKLVSAQFFSASLFDSRLTKDNSLNGDAFLRITGCAAGTACYGTLFPDTVALYEGYNLVIDVRLLEAPTINVSPSASSINVLLKASVIVINTTTAEETTVLTVTYSALFPVALAMDGLVIKFTRGVITYTVVDVTFPDTPVDSTASPVDGTSVDALFSFLSVVYTNMMDVHIGNTITIPNIRGVTYVDPVLTLINGALVFSTDVAYTLQV